MSPPLTLKETMRAAGDPRLTDWHQKLVSKGIEKKALDEKLNTDIARRDQVKMQMDKIQPDVEQFETRQEKEKEVSLLLCVLLKSDEVEGYSGSVGCRR
jgi:SOS response regulatory protein OraA/RecX